jgi:predicted esterase
MLASLIALLAAADCPSGYSKVMDGACLALPKGPPRALVVYLHGMLPPKPDWTAAREFRLIANEATRRGVAVLAVRGEKGFCAWGDDVRDDWCWPCDMSMLPLAGKFVDRIARAVHAAHLDTGPPIIAGFSNGGYFTAMLASDVSFDAKAYVIFHAGQLDGQTFDADRWRPTLLVGAAQDPIQLPAMRHLAQTLEKSKWKATLAVNDGKHEITSRDARSLVDFVEQLAVGD